MEHLDSLAGSIAYKHILGPVQNVGNLEQSGFYIVTASVDRLVPSASFRPVLEADIDSLDMLSPLDPTQDLRLSGHVIYTGRSSMEVAVRMESVGMDKSSSKTVMIGCQAFTTSITWASINVSSQDGFLWCAAILRYRRLCRSTPWRFIRWRRRLCMT